MTIDKVHLVLAYDGEVYVDSAWTTPDGAEQRIAFLKSTRAAFKAYESKGLKSLAVRLDASGVAIHLELPPVPVPLAPKEDGRASNAGASIADAAREGSEEAANTDPAAVANLIRKRIEESGLTPTEWARAYDALTPDRIRAALKQPEPRPGFPAGEANELGVEQSSATATGLEGSAPLAPEVSREATTFHGDTAQFWVFDLKGGGRVSIPPDQVRRMWNAEQARNQFDGGANQVVRPASGDVWQGKREETRGAVVPSARLENLDRSGEKASGDTITEPQIDLGAIAGAPPSIQSESRPHFPVGEGTDAEGLTGQGQSAACECPARR